MLWPNQKEIATLIINNVAYTNWESVSVRHSVSENPFYLCRFTCSEGMPLAKDFAAMRIRPGDECTVLLGGELAFTGKVALRQVFFDANRHTIEIQCVNNSAIYSSAWVTKTMEFKNYTLEKIITEGAAKFGMRHVVEGGTLPSKKIKRASLSPGESFYDFADLLSRNFATTQPIYFSTNETGDFVSLAGPSGGSDTLIEGVHLIEGREIVFDPTSSGKPSVVIGQGAGSDEEHGAKVAHQPIDKSNDPATFLERWAGLTGGSGMPTIVVAEMPTSFSDIERLKQRNDTERGLNAANEITVHATVQGWFRPSGGLWKRNQEVRVISPMLIMSGGEGLRAVAVTFSQTNETGTRTTLELRNVTAIGKSTPPVV